MARLYAEGAMLPLLATLSPNAAILILTAGFALIALEFNRPGSILPGAAGLLLTLFAIGSLSLRHPRPAPALLIAASMALLLLQYRRTLLWLFPAGATILLCFSIARLLRPSVAPGINSWIAALCGLILGTGITVLTRIARRARKNKGLD